MFKSLECFTGAWICFALFIIENKIKLDWVHISADRETYLMSLTALFVFKANGILEVYFYIKMPSKFHTLFFSKLTYVTTSVLGYCVFLNLRTVVKLFAAFLQIKEAKIIVIEGSGHKCTSNNSTRESYNLKDLFCQSYILNFNWG